MLPGFPRRSGELPGGSSRKRNRMGVCDRRQHLHKALYSCGFENPVVANNATLWGLKSMEKGRFPQELCGFFGVLPIFSHFYWFLSILVAGNGEFRPRKGRRPRSSVQPE